MSELTTSIYLKTGVTFLTSELHCRPSSFCLVCKLLYSLFYCTPSPVWVWSGLFGPVKPSDTLSSIFCFTIKTRLTCTACWKAQLHKSPQVTNIRQTMFSFFILCCYKHKYRNQLKLWTCCFFFFFITFVTLTKQQKHQKGA